MKEEQPAKTIEEFKLRNYPIVIRVIDAEKQILPQPPCGMKFYHKNMFIMDKMKYCYECGKELNGESEVIPKEIMKMEMEGYYTGARLDYTKVGEDHYCRMETTQPEIKVTWYQIIAFHMVYVRDNFVYNRLESAYKKMKEY
jgi:hypothetical protein